MVEFNCKSRMLRDIHAEEAQPVCRKYIKKFEGKRDVTEAYMLLVLGIIVELAKKEETNAESN